MACSLRIKLNVTRNTTGLTALFDDTCWSWFSICSPTYRLPRLKFTAAGVLSWKMSYTASQKHLAFPSITE